MLTALATPNSAFKPSIKKVKNTWRLKKFKKRYIEKGGASSSSENSTESSVRSSAVSCAFSSTNDEF
ncbi:hypothetical protein KGF56_003400 [Candida oxycetoniae]|uniref:Uncharacterized protein n=1 Tax=Candida oxycetoniae TaxID=497107 RepID=A0AAI9SWD7_9ASCO|nr:uncharacterized protein KGF56_003400 [Candida oxycetoniae]KAI3403765.2 hypothetical protein KGF56_003400 [Candida oxycetoniae]